MPHSLPLINADVSMIERVVTNLLDNAVRHSPQGSTIRLKVWQEEAQLQVEVSDSGPGIDEALRDQLFQRPSVLGHPGVAGRSRRVRAADCKTDAGTARRWDQADGFSEWRAV